MNKSAPLAEPRPWYREPWPWVAIAIPAAAVIAGFITLYLAISNPDYLVVEEDRYREINSELRAQSRSGSEPDAETAPGADEDGEH